MSLVPLQKITCLVILSYIIVGCSGSDKSYSKTTTYLGKTQVVSGLVYGYAPNALQDIETDAAVTNKYLSKASGQFALANIVASQPGNGILFSARLSDNSHLHSVWYGASITIANIIVTIDQADALDPVSVAVSPDSSQARININPVTDLGYWFWRYDNLQSPYSDYVNMVFRFLMNNYGIPEQNALKDYPSPELLHFLDTIKIIVSDNAAGFMLVTKATGQTICTVDFAPFLVCR